MEKKLSVRQIMVVASMLFGLLFGAGNLIFPVSMGQLAGAHMWQAVAGFVVTGVGVPILGVAALGISQECAGIKRQSGKEIRDLFHLRAASDGGAILRDSPVRHRFFYHRSRAGPFRGKSRPGFVFVFPGLFCGGFISGVASGRDPDLGGEGADAFISGVSGDPGAPCSDSAYGGDIKHTAGPELYGLSFLPGISGGI